jgi:hypothetical protein
MSNQRIATADLDSLINVIGLSPKDPLDTFVGLYPPRDQQPYVTTVSLLQKYGSTCLPGHSFPQSSSTPEQQHMRSPVCDGIK